LYSDLLTDIVYIESILGRYPNSGLREEQVLQTLIEVADKRGVLVEMDEN
jgi:hypothetical protein